MAREAEAGKAEAMTVRDNQVQSHARMEKSLQDLRSELAGIRTGRATVGLLDHVRVDYYGTPTPVNQLATLSVPEPNMLLVQPWDVSQIAAVEKALRASDLGVNPVNDGKLLRVPIPPLTEERRKEMVKRLHRVLEDHRIAVRNIRRDGNEQIKRLLKEKKIGEDEERKAHEDVQKMTDEYVKKVEDLGAVKEKDILHV
jgi:ribosome recycling factor